MENSVSVNHMTKICNYFVENSGITERGMGDVCFAENVREKIAERAAWAEGTSDEATMARDQMTMAEYKQFIYDKICQIPIHSSQTGWHWNIESKDRFWERKAKRKKQWAEQLDEWLDRRAMARRWKQEQLDRAIGMRNAEKRHLNHTRTTENKILPVTDIYEPNIAAILTDLVSSEVLG